MEVGSAVCEAPPVYSEISMLQRRGTCMLHTPTSPCNTFPYAQPF